MNKHRLKENHSSESELAKTTQVNSRKKQPKITVGITIKPSLLAEARKRNLNISRICEQALLSIINYIQPQNETQSFKVLNPCSFQENEAGPEGFEPSIYGLWHSSGRQIHKSK